MPRQAQQTHTLGFNPKTSCDPQGADMNPLMKISRLKACCGHMSFRPPGGCRTAEPSSIIGCCLNRTSDDDCTTSLSAVPGCNAFWNLPTYGSDKIYTSLLSHASSNTVSLQSKLFFDCRFFPCVCIACGHLRSVRQEKVGRAAVSFGEVKHHSSVYWEKLT